MKILVFSDTHLYLPFDQKKFDFLKKIINSADRIIINGDFFDDYMISFEDFINSPWNQLFSILKQKKAVYIFGNHDLKKFSDKRTSLFSVVQNNIYKLTVNNQQFVFTHGQQFRKTPDLFFKNISNIKPLATLVVRITHTFRQLMTNIFGRIFLKLRFAYRNAFKEKALKTIKTDQFIIVGHNHWGGIDEKNHFACCGAILYGYAQYLIIDSSAKVTLHEEWYDR